MQAKTRLALFCLCLLLFTSLSGYAARALAASPYVPPALEDWKAWVLHGQEARLCPSTYDGKGTHCLWPSRLHIEIGPGGGRFAMDVLVLSAGWAELPGGPGLWPENAELDADKAPVVIRNGRPRVEVQPGAHRVQGGFAWKEMPETIRVPAGIGLIDLSIDGRRVEFPVLDRNGRLWLQRRTGPESREDRLEVRVFRLIDDDIPMQVRSLLKLTVSGRGREIRLDDVLPPEARPMRLASPLPARIGPEGELMLQARPGHWQVEITSRFQGPIEEIGPWPGRYGQEIWAFQARNHLRMVKIDGVPSIDPGQTDVPDGWRKLPTYLVDPGSTIKFQQLRRGDPDPAPDRLNLARTWWLDFDGGGFTIQDRITGTMSRRWNLVMKRPGLLGRVSVDGTDQLITGQGPEQAPGVELRRGRLDLTADSRFEAGTERVLAVGWDHDFQSVSGRLNLPPGWKLLSASGVDVPPGTWVQRWTLLDFFLILVITFAVIKLTSWPWGILALVAVGLSYHEPGSPRLVWLHLLAAMALLKVLPDGWFKRLAGLWRLGAIIALVVMTIPFMVQQVRWGVYPQLEPHTDMRAGVAAPEAENIADMTSAGEAMKKAPSPKSSSYYRSKQKASPKRTEEPQALQQQAVLTQDPNALIQTGPGLPTWDWRSIPLRWNGPVDRGQDVRLWILSPRVNLFLALLRVVLLVLLTVGLIGPGRWWRGLDRLGPVAAMLAAGLLLAGPVPAAASETGFPPQSILDELQKRLLAPPDCLPNCAEISRMELTAEPGSIHLRIEIQAARKTAVPLPGAAENWLPQQIILDQAPAEGLLRDEKGNLWLLAPAGVHVATLIGPVPATDSFQIPLPLKPRRTTVNARGWLVKGVDENGQAGSSLQLTLQDARSPERPSPGASVLPPFLQVERVISLGLTWQIATRIRRLTPPGTPIVVSLPLLPGESVTTAGLRVENGEAQVNMDPAADQFTYGSTIEITNQIRLEAPRGVPWTEVWILDASPIWHCELQGIPVVHHQDAQGHWQPQWRPWPGENVTISVTRPKSIPGRLVTIDAASLEWTPGQRFNKAILTMTARASRGGQHRIVLPEKARLQQVRIDGKSQPIGQAGREVLVPLRPGSQQIQVEWQRPADSSVLREGPEVMIGDQAVNANVTFKMPGSLWVLWTAGPRMGPAVLFWSYLLVVVLAALALGRVRLTPLRTRHWLLLGLGLTQVHPLLAIVIVCWLLALGLRHEHRPPDHWLAFDSLQIALALWTLIALVGLYTAVKQGLLGIPDMQIAGNHSTVFQLNWTQDRITSTMPRPLVISLPKLVFNLAMLAWALWLTWSLFKWLRWGWGAIGQGGLWRKWVRKAKSKPGPTPATASTRPDGDTFILE
ncbi:MAG: hypothetical protein KKB20_25450 [Proteobacteria bacterium]|nr:hypothetical protein [Pseudomonadota bacterium]